MKVNQVQHESFRQLILLLEKTGVSLDQLLAEVRQRGVSAFDVSKGGIASPDAVILLEAAVELSSDPCLMIRLGQQFGLASYGSFGFALMTCGSLRESVQLLLRYGQILFEPKWTSHAHEGGLLLRANINLDFIVRQQLITELSFSNLAAMGRSLHGKRVEGAEIQLSYSRPAHSACYDSMLAASVTFDCEHSQFFLPAQVLDMPVKTANRSEHVIRQQQCEEMLRGLSRVEKTTTAVRQLLIQSAGDFLDIAQIAESLHVSERTLRRRLEAESTSFRSTFEEIRDLLAREYLAKTELTVADIAHLLGYSETVNFRRAFVRWNSLTPRGYRLEQAS